MCNYVINQQHRNGNSQKSQWTITVLDERNVFQKACSSNTLVWGIYIYNNRINYLGENKHQEQVFLAKFSENQSIWHGYPADYIRNTHDIPSREAMLKWNNSGYITKSEMRKIIKGQKCNL